MIDITGVYVIGMKPEELAEKVLSIYFKDKEPSFPINPFKMIREMGIVYQFMDFEDLEGIYIVPEDEDDIPLIGINFNRHITRQRFTAAHEICHHIKDQNNGICPIDGNKSSVEKYADKFASELLMPRKYLKREAEKYAVNGVVCFDDVLKIADYFGTSMQATVFSLAYKFHMIDGKTDVDSIKKRVEEYQPDHKKVMMGLDAEYVALWEQLINSYEFFWSVDNRHAWYVFKNDFIYHENRLEKLHLDDDVVAEIIADLRYNKSDSQYCNEACDEIIQVAGHSELYDYIYDTKDRLEIYKIQKLHQLLYKYAPFPEAGGVYRQSNNFVTEAEFETADFHDIFPELIKLSLPMQELVSNLDLLTFSDVIEASVRIHHGLTVIHPFADGNGRCSRAILNWIFRLKGLPPVYIKYPEKEEYYEGLKMADSGQGYNKLYKVVMRESIRSSIKLNQLS